MEKLMLFINSKFQALTQHSFFINPKALCKNDNIIFLTSQVVKVRHRERKQLHIDCPAGQ